MQMIKMMNYKKYVIFIIIKNIAVNIKIFNLIIILLIKNLKLSKT